MDQKRDEERKKERRKKEEERRRKLFRYVHLECEQTEAKKPHDDGRNSLVK